MMNKVTPDMMYEQAKTTCQKAYAPYSHFQVGCCLRTPDNQLFSGCNIENASYGLTHCAEAAAIACMVSHGTRQIAEAVIMANTDVVVVPCGACRQRLVEFASPNILVHLGNNNKICKTMTLGQLLPEAFTSNYF